MKRAARSLLLVAIGVFIGASLAGVTVHAQRPGPGTGTGRGAGGGFGNFSPQALVERAVHGSWALISFDMDSTDEQLTELRKVYQKAVEESRAELADIGEVDPNNRREVMRDLMRGMMEGQAALREAVKGHLNEEQAAKLDEWYKEQASAARRGGGGGGGGRRNREGGGPPGGEGGEGRQRRSD